MGAENLAPAGLKINRNRTIILLAVSYGHETWPIIVKGEPMLRVFENRVQRMIFGPW